MKQLKEFIYDISLTALFALALTIFLMNGKIEKENERLYEDIKQTEWVNSAKEVQPQNNIVNLGLEDGSK